MTHTEARYYMIPMAEPLTPYVISTYRDGFTVRHVESPHPIMWRGANNPVIYPCRERAESVVRTACNRRQG